LTVEAADLLTRSRIENEVLSEMAGLTSTGHPYDDVVHGLLDLIEHVVSSPFLGVSIRELEGVAHYVRLGREADRSWGEGVAEGVAKTLDSILQSGSHAMAGTQHHSISAPAAWIMSFTARSRSGRLGSLVIAAQAPLTLTPEEEQLMGRLVQQTLLVLDHALLLEKIEHLEVEDQLTGVVNQHRLLEILEYEMRRHRFTGKWLALSMIDVEGLDSINRSYGRRYGNHILQKLAGMLQSSVRPIDVVARHGHDEFAVVLPEMTEEDGRRLVEELHQRFGAMEFAGGEVRLTAGTAHVKPDETLTAEAFLRRGEQALHEAKRYERGWSTMWESSARLLPRS
jgi:diguanylate cyclase (GGDEF)-like protein